jgi:hypothetical protein
MVRFLNEATGKVGDIRICSKRSHHAALDHSVAQAGNRKLKDKTHN